MAIARGAGTEIIRSAQFEYVASNTTPQTLIFGEQHHIYTVLSIIIFAKAASTGMEVYIDGYDALEGTTTQGVCLFNPGSMSINETYVFNDKFSFNGHEPTDFVGPMEDATKQNAIADQGSSSPNKLRMGKLANGDQYEVLISYIEQNNA